MQPGVQSLEGHFKLNEIHVPFDCEKISPLKIQFFKYYRSLDHYDLIKTNFSVSLRSADFLSQLGQLAIIQIVKKMTTKFSNFQDFKILTYFYNQFVSLEELTFDANCDPGNTFCANIVLDRLNRLKKLF